MIPSPGEVRRLARAELVSRALHGGVVLLALLGAFALFAGGWP